MIDEQGYRANVGMIILNQDNKVFLGKRIGQKSWQFPQGGVDADDQSLTEAMYRELWEETGLTAADVELVSQTVDWLCYDLPRRYRRRNTKPLCIGQKQKWFLLRLKGSDKKINFTRGEKAEFDAFRWVNYWYPIRKVIYFKRQVYQNALNELASAADVCSRRRLSPYTYKKTKKHRKKR